MLLRTTSFLLLCFLLSFSYPSPALGQSLGGGSGFADARFFDTDWLGGCPNQAEEFSNRVAFEPVTAMDACGGAPACATGTPGSDVWFKFYAHGVGATIVIQPRAGFDVAIQAFSGSTCAGLVTIGCVDAGGNNATETLNLSGLVENQVYHFRVFGATNVTPNRTGIYVLCGSSGMFDVPLPVELGDFRGRSAEDGVHLSWTTLRESNNARFVVERSVDGRTFAAVGEVAGAGNSSVALHYDFVDGDAVVGSNVYRLRTVDVAGAEESVGLVEVLHAGAVRARVRAWPNPVRSSLRVEVVCARAQEAVLRVVDLAGRVVLRQVVALEAGTNMVLLAGAEGLEAGLHRLVVDVDGRELHVGLSVVR